MIHPQIISLRKELHQNPELSGKEVNTAQRIKKFIEKHHTCEFIENVGGSGLLAIYNFTNTGKTVVIRCELDALPIKENNDFGYKSKVEGASHKCGHDGHMSIVSGLIFWIKNQSFNSGKIVLLFQPAEETGKGANEVLRDERFIKLKPDYIFALHNIPGEKLHGIITMIEGFSAEVISFSICLTGEESHAAEPENGINPADTMANIISELSELNVPEPKDENFAVLTPVHIKMGDTSYGVSPGKGELHYTIRTWSETTMIILKTNILSIIEQQCHKHQINFDVDWFEHFPASENDPSSIQHIIEVATKNGLEIVEREYPFKFGEDFGWFSRKYKVAMFGLGAGIHTPALHHADYDFPDEIIETGITMFAGLIKKALS